jgi:multiple sugar transport system ATP-binding protein
MAKVTLTDVRKVYPGPVEAVRCLSLQIPDGSFFVLVGPSGCGKSTTVRMIAGLEDATSGTIEIGERVVNRVPPRERGVALVSQNPALYPHLSVAGNLAFALRGRGLTRQEETRRVHDAAQRLGIESVLSRRPRALSGGQRQRAALGRAMVREPEVFLFDEPLSDLDAALRVSMRRELRALQQNLGTTTVLVTHDQEEAMALGDHIAVMVDGTLEQVGPPMEVYQRPANRFVASFLGSPAMNFVEGEFDADSGSFVGADRTVRCALSESQSSSVRACGGGSIVLGVRPSALAVVPGKDDASARVPANAFEAMVREVVPMGDALDLRLVVGSVELTARVDADIAVKPGETRLIALDSQRVHLFQPGAFGAAIPTRVDLPVEVR